MNCPRCKKQRETINNLSATYCVCGYNFVDPERSTIHANERFVYLNTKTSHKLYESMVVYALHYALRDVKVMSQFPVIVDGYSYYIDAYIPEVNLAIEIDEPYHERQQDLDLKRELRIKDYLGCQFIRIKCNQSLYEQVDEIVELVRSKNLPSWNAHHPEPNQRSGEFSANSWAQLVANNVPEIMDTFFAELKSQGELVREESIKGIPSTSNGEYGFLLEKSGLTFAIYMRKTKTLRVRVVKINEEVSQEFINKHLIQKQNKSGIPRFYALENRDSYQDKIEVLSAIDNLLKRKHQYN